MAEPKRAKMTIPEFLRWQELQEDRYELVDGEPVLHRMMPARASGTTRSP